MNSHPYPDGFHELPEEERNRFFAAETANYRRMAHDDPAALYQHLVATQKPKCARAKQRATAEVVRLDVGRASKPPRFQIEHFCDIEPPSGSEWLIKGVIPREGVGTLFGNSGTYKSFCAVDVAWHIAAGEPWAGRKVTQASVVYLALEGAQGVRKRLYGVRKMHDLGSTRPPLYAVGASMNLGTESGDIVQMIADIEALGIIPGCVIVDTLSASMAGGDENGPGMAMFISNCQRLSQHFGCFVWAIHHLGHNGEKRERGHSSLIGNVDTRVLCEKPQGQQAVLELIKCKDGPDGLRFLLQMEVVEFGDDEDGDPITTLAVRSAEEVEAQPKRAKIVSVPPLERLLMHTVELGLIEAGQDFRVPDGPMVRAVTEEAIRSRYYDRVAEEADPAEPRDKIAERQRKSFRRSLSSAIKAMRLIAGERNGRRVVWLP
jgi:hypothetical protein